jgi:hypothetical protein
MMLRNRMINNKELHQEDLDNNIEITFFSTIINNLYNLIIFSFNYICKAIKIFIKVSGIYLLWIFLHYIASQLYIELCVPKSIMGFLISPFMTATPQCQGLRWVVYNAANIINNMWILLGTWICSTLLLLNNNDINET